MSQKRTGFVLDAQSMGLTKSPTAEQEVAESVEKPSTSTLSLVNVPEGNTPNAQCNASIETISTDYYRCRLKSLRETSAEENKYNLELNSIFLNRLDEIDMLEKQSGDAKKLITQLRLVTFQEWVDLLLHVNNVIVGNMSALEKETYGKIMACFQSVRGEHQQTLDENRKLRKDVCAIIQIVRNAYHRNNWNMDNVCLETLTIEQLLGTPRDQCRPESESEKVSKCMKSLVDEMAAKHDEVCHLQAQLCAMDEVVQTARQKLLLKDQCIAQLHEQLTEVTDLLMSSHAPSEPSAQDEAVKQAQECTTSDNISTSLLEDLKQRNEQESEIVRILNTELNELINLLGHKEVETVECQRKRLSCFFEKLNTERNETVQKLECLRAQLNQLQNDLDHCEPINSKSETDADDPDMQLVEALRRRLRSLNNCNKEMHSKCQRLETEYKELQAKYESERCINQRNCHVLKELAELICRLRSSDFSYNEIYAETSTENPFCQAIMEMYEKNNEQEQQLSACNSDTSSPTQPHTSN